ncbi:MAG TPA: TerC family protein [Steroidobacteraceae bacterium]|nr:TerC family protein [Steroidobacteraceae bacterium]
MEMLHQPIFWAELAAIVWINLLVSGDNAVMIALAARSLPPRQQRLAVFWGTAAAVAFRIALTVFAARALEWPWLKVAGGLLLLWIGVKLLAPDTEAPEVSAHTRLVHAIRTILVADLVMSIDNVIAVAAAANEAAPTPELAAMKYTLLVLGLAISIPIVVFGSVIMLGVMARFPFVILAGAALLGWIAGDIIVTDPAVTGWVASHAGWLRQLHVAAMGGALFVVLAGRWLRSERGA